MRSRAEGTAMQAVFSCRQTGSWLGVATRRVNTSEGKKRGRE
jgi:hypothetical protein